MPRVPAPTSLAVPRPTRGCAVRRERHDRPDRASARRRADPPPTAATAALWVRPTTPTAAAGVRPAAVRVRADALLRGPARLAPAQLPGLGHPLHGPVLPAARRRLHRVRRAGQQQVG